MRIRTASDLLCTTVAWLPLLGIVVAALWVLTTGLLHLEMISFGSEFLVGNDETTNLPTPIGGTSDADLLLQALESGDTERMAGTLAQVESRHAEQAAATVPR